MLTNLRIKLSGKGGGGGIGGADGGGGSDGGGHGGLVEWCKNYTLQG